MSLLLFFTGGAGGPTASGFRLIVDPAAEAAGNVELDLTDGGFFRLTRLEIPDPALKSVWVSSFDTEGQSAASEHGYDNREIKAGLRIYGVTAADLNNKISYVEQKLAKLNREKGTLRLVYPSGSQIVFDVEAAQASGPSLDNAFISPRRTEIELVFTCRPFYRAPEIGDLVDAFATDSIGSGLWAFDAGTGTLSVSGGQLVPSSSVEKRLYRTDRDFYDAQVTCKVLTGASGAEVSGPIIKRLDANNYLKVRIVGAFNLLDIRKVDGGVETGLASAAFTPAVGTNYWVRARIEGDKVTAEVFTAAPTPQSAPAQTVVHTLAGGDATKYGRTVKGKVGMALAPGATSARYDDFTAQPNLYIERTLPVLITPPIYGIAGDVPALGRLVVDEIQGVPRWQLRWGLQSRYIGPGFVADTGSGGSKTLFDEAEGALWVQKGGAFPVVGPAGSSGTGSNVQRQANLAAGWQAMLQTNTAQHIGSFEVLARMHMPTTNTGAVSVAFEWGQDLASPVHRNQPITFEANHASEGRLLWRSLGLIHLQPPANKAHTEQWTGRIVARSTVAGDDLDIDCVALRPTTEGGGLLSARVQYETTGLFTGRDEFDQTAGALTGKTAPVGGTWAGAGDTDDFQVETTGKTAQRAVTSDTDFRYATLDLNHTSTVVQCDMTTTLINANAELGIVARYADTNNHLKLAVQHLGVNGLRARLMKRVGGTLTLLTDAVIPLGIPIGAALPWLTLRLYVDAGGRAYGWAFPKDGFAGAPRVAIQDDALATGGALATGDPGFLDIFTAGTAPTRNFDNFQAFVPTLDAAVFANEKLELRHDGAERSTNSGGTWTTISVRRGRYLRLPPAGREGRTSRLFLLATRNDLDAMPDGGIDDLQAQLFVTPRGLIAPEA